MMRCLIVDDEPIALRVLNAHLEKIPDVEVAGMCTDAMEALSIVREGEIDLVFLDIEMPALSGVGFIEALESPPRFVFTTAHRDYAVRGFELDAVDYLLKPISLPRLLRAIDKVRRLDHAKSRRRESAGAAEAKAQVLAVPVDRQTVTVPLDNVRYIESMGDYVKIYTFDRPVVSKQRISDLADRLRPHGFLRIHRSFVVALAHVTSYSAEEIHVDDQVLPISRSYRQMVLDRLAARDI